MKRKDGLSKKIPLKKLPVFKGGFKDFISKNISDNNILTDDKKISVISFFSGCGGLDLGFLGGFNFLGKNYPRTLFYIHAAYDNLQDAVDCYKLNISNNIFNYDLSQIKTDDMDYCDVLIGGFPCQNFSSAGHKNGFNGYSGNLYKSLVAYMERYHPKIVVGENVSYLKKISDGKCYNKIINDFENAGYHFNVWDIYAPDYGVPQSRNRIIFIGVRNDISGFPIKPQKTHENNYITISDAISDLENINDETITNQSQYFVSSKATSGGGQGDNKNVFDKVAYCIRANSRGRIQFHYKLDRRLTVRECARLQTFPDEFVFPFYTQRNLTLIGNAVPPVIGYYIAISIQNFLKNNIIETSKTMKARESSLMDLL